MVNDVDCVGTASFQVRPSTGDKIKRRMNEKIIMRLEVIGRGRAEKYRLLESTEKFRRK